MMKIGEKIDKVRKEILDGNTTLGNDIAKKGIEAIFAGIGSNEWEDLMSHFKNNSAELDRLCGKEEAFNKSRWGLACLVYIAGNATCTAQTAMDTGTKRGMTPAMITNLDAEDKGMNIFKNAETAKAYDKASDNI